MFVKVAVDYRLAECTVCYVLQSCLLCTYRQYFSQSLLSLPTAAANDIHKFCALHLWKPLCHASFIHKKIKISAINKPPRIIWHWPFYIVSVPLLSLFIPLFSLHPKHSYLDRETSLILKSIAGKPSHLLTKVTSSYTRFFFFFLFIRYCHVCAHCASLLLCMCISGKIHASVTVRKHVQEINLLVYLIIKLLFIQLEELSHPLQQDQAYNESCTRILGNLVMHK